METKPGAQFRIHVWVKGYVQGVGFRVFVQKTASVLGLNGWVRNVGDDTVETVAEGAARKIGKICRGDKKRSACRESKRSQGRMGDCGGRVQKLLCKVQHIR